MTDKNMPAFPTNGFNHLGQPMPINNGITLRDWFAGMALQGLISATPEQMSYPDPEYAAELVFKYADEIMKARGE